MAKRRIADRRQPLFSYLDRSPGETALEAMSIEESETLLDSSISSNPCDFNPPAYVRETSLGSITTSTQSTTLNSTKFLSPAVTVVDIDLKSRSIEECNADIQPPPPHHNRRTKHRKCYDGITDEMAMKSGRPTVLMAIESNQNIIRDTLEPTTSGT